MLWFFLQFRQRITELYPELFGDGQAADGFDRQAQFGKKWGWYSSYYGLAQGDVRRFDEVSKLRLTTCLTFLTFEKEKNEIEIQQIRK